MPIKELKQSLALAETSYSHALARGDWGQAMASKSEVAVLRRQVGKLIKARMSQGRKQ